MGIITTHLQFGNILLMFIFVDVQRYVKKWEIEYVFKSIRSTFVIRHVISSRFCVPLCITYYHSSVCRVLKSLQITDTNINTERSI